MAATNSQVLTHEVMHWKKPTLKIQKAVRWKIKTATAENSWI